MQRISKNLGFHLRRDSKRWSMKSDLDLYRRIALG